MPIQGVVQFGEFQLDPNLRLLTRQDLPLKISAKPLSTLEYLIRNRQRVVPKTELLREIWGGQQEINTVEQAVRQIRKALGDNPDKPAYIETVPGQGYRFIAEIKSSKPEEPEKTAAPLEHPNRRKWLMGAVAGVSGVCAAGFAAYRLTRRPEPAVRTALDGSKLVAMGETGKVLWAHKFPGRLAEPIRSESWRTQIADLNGDGLAEVLYAPTLEATPDEQPLDMYCFSAAGKVLWQYCPTASVEFRRSGLNGPWKLLHALIVPGNPGSSIWIAAAHTVWWPAFITRLSGKGTPRVEFVNSGNIHSLLNIKNRSVSFIAATGVNNEYRQAVLVVLRENGQASVSPQGKGSEFECVTGCPSCRPYRYILMPRTELNEAADQVYSVGIAIRSRPDGLTVGVRETAESENSFYDFSMDFEPERVGYGSAYRLLHEKYQREGLLKHKYADCPEARVAASLRICEEDGHWRSVTIPRFRPYETS